MRSDEGRNETRGGPACCSLSLSLSLSLHGSLDWWNSTLLSCNHSLLSCSLIVFSLSSCLFFVCLIPSFCLFIPLFSLLLTLYFFILVSLPFLSRPSFIHSLSFFLSFFLSSAVPFLSFLLAWVSFHHSCFFLCLSFILHSLFLS